jgi:hypothetical protein
MRHFLQLISLSDRYERKAQLQPGLLLALVPALTLGAVLHGVLDWQGAAGSALGVECLAATVLGHLARARGRRAEEQLWKTWGGPPTTRWLRPWDRTCSDQQKSRWRGAIKRITGLSLPASVADDGGQEEADRQITDAIRQLRYSVRGKPEASLLAIHNEEYGFARNLYGVRWHWVAISMICLASCGFAFAWGFKPYAGLAIASGFSIASLLVSRELELYVRRSADRYAESLFATAIVISQLLEQTSKTNKAV